MLEILGIIFLLVIAKFVYDTYLSNNTEKRWEEYRQENPERAYQVERNTGLNLGTSASAREAAAFNKLTELQQLLIKQSLAFYKQVESREHYFQLTPPNKRNLEQYFKSVCSILSAAVIEAALDIDRVGRDENIRKELRLNLRSSYILFVNNIVKSNKVIFPNYFLPVSNDNAVSLHAIVKMEQYAADIKNYLSTGNLCNYREEYDDDGDPYEYPEQVQYAFIKDIYEVGFQEVGGSIKVNFNELSLHIDECESEIINLLRYIKTSVSSLRSQ